MLKKHLHRYTSATSGASRNPLFLPFRYQHFVKGKRKGNNIRWTKEVKHEWCMSFDIIGYVTCCWYLASPSLSTPRFTLFHPPLCLFISLFTSLFCKQLYLCCSLCMSACLSSNWKIFSLYVFFFLLLFYLYFVFVCTYVSRCCHSVNCILTVIWVSIVENIFTYIDLFTLLTISLI